MFATRDILVFGVVAGVIAAVLLFLLPWSRQRGRWALAAVATFAGFIAWNFTLRHTNATGFNVDAPVVAVSWADTGSGVLAFVVTALALTLYERREQALYVVGSAFIAGLGALVLDIFVL